MTDASTIRPTRQFSEVEQAAGLADLHSSFLDEVGKGHNPTTMLPWVETQIVEIVTPDTALPESANWYKMRFLEDALHYWHRLGGSSAVADEISVPDHSEEISPPLKDRIRRTTPIPIPPSSASIESDEDVDWDKIEEDPEVQRLAASAARDPELVGKRTKLVKYIVTTYRADARDTDLFSNRLISEATSGGTTRSPAQMVLEPKRSLMSKLNPFPLMWRIFSKIGGWLIFHLLVFAAFAAIAGVYFYEADTDRQTICNDPDVGLDCYLASGEADWTGDTGKKAAIGGLVGVVFVIIGERVASRYKIIRKSTYEELRREPTL